MVGPNWHSIKAKLRKRAREIELESQEAARKEDEYWRAYEVPKSRAALRREEKAERRADAAKRRAEGRMLAERERRELETKLGKKVETEAERNCFRPGEGGRAAVEMWPEKRGRPTVREVQAQLKLEAANVLTAEDRRFLWRECMKTGRRRRTGRMITPDDCLLMIGAPNTNGLKQHHDYYEEEEEDEDDNGDDLEDNDGVGIQGTVAELGLWLSNLN